jgi:hypothetical protein
MTAMDQHNNRPKRQFFIATYDGDFKSYVSSEHVVSLCPAENPHYTEMRTSGGGAYSHIVYARASVDRVKELFAQHGYDFVDIDELPKAPVEDAAAEKKTSKGFLRRLMP